MPKTLAEALILLAAERERAAELESAAKRAQTAEGMLRNQLATLRDELTDERKQLATLRAELADERAQLARLRDELAEERQKIVEMTSQWRADERRADELEERCHSLDHSLDETLAYATELEGELDDARRKTEDVRYDLERETLQLRRESDELRQTKERAAKENEGLTRRVDELRVRLDESERALKLRDEDLTKQRRSFAASERAHHEIHETADSVVRSFAEERNRRLTAERHVDLLRQELWRVMTTPPSLLNEAQRLAVLDLHNSLLSTELQAVKHHRDVAVDEQQRLAARLLHMMSPGRYLEHAAAEGYDITTDPLIKLMQQSVLIENQLAQWQRATGKRQTARAWDPSQTLVEQAYAAAIKERWKHVDHKHKSFRATPDWRVTGILLDPQSEQHLLKVHTERIATMQQKIGT